MIIVEDRQIPWEKGLNVAQLIKQLDRSFSCAVVRLNGKLVSRPSFAEIQVPDESRIDLIDLVAGG